jgi:hypothetical protein
MVPTFILILIILHCSPKKIPYEGEIFFRIDYGNLCQESTDEIVQRKSDIQNSLRIGNPNFNFSRLESGKAFDSLLFRLKLPDYHTLLTNDTLMYTLLYNYVKYHLIGQAFVTIISKDNVKSGIFIHCTDYAKSFSFTTIKGKCVHLRSNIFKSSQIEFVPSKPVIF